MDLPDYILEEIDYFDNITSCNKVIFILVALSLGQGSLYRWQQAANVADSSMALDLRYNRNSTAKL